MIYIEPLKEKISHKEQSEIGRKLLLKGLQIEFGLSEIPEMGFGEFGKPFFKTFPNIHFNISHCEKAVVCIISNTSIGIDVESINPFDKELAEYITTPDELDHILNNQDPDLAFTILWTKKESYCKLTGKGLDTRKAIQCLLINNPVSFQTFINKTGGYVITSCTY